MPAYESYINHCSSSDKLDTIVNRGGAEGLKGREREREIDSQMYI